jgi:uncharacterized protein YidB (DUF937 family)
MGLLDDILNGLQGATGGGQQPQQSQRMSPLAMALLGLLAYKALSRPGGLSGNAGPGAGTRGAPADAGGLGGGSGGLGNILQGGLGGLLGGAAAGGVLSGGLNDLLKQLQDSGQGEVAKSWVGTGQNQDIDPDDLGKALGADQINALSAQSGLSRNDLLAGLAQQLPQLVDQLTPQGRLPTEQEASRWI